MEGAAFSGFQDPLLIEPMLLIFWITVKPESAAPHAAPGDGLFDERARHQCRLIQQDACEGTALNQSGAGLISAAEEEEGVGMAVKANAERVIGPAFSDGHAEFCEVREEFGQKVSANGGNSFPTDTELTAIKIPFGPEEEGEPHRKGLPTAHGAVADNGIKAVGIPPGKDPGLFW